MLKPIMSLQKKVFAFFLMLFAFAFVSNAQAIDNNNPYTLMQQTSKSLFGQITADQAKIKKDPNYLKTIVKDTLMPYVHVKYAGSLVLGRQLRTIDRADREKFFNAFGDFIVQSYAQALTLYHNQKVEIEKAKPIDGNIVSIKVQIIQSNATAPVNLNFFWRKNTKTGAWQVYDLAVEGVSMVDTKRQEWSPILRKSGINALIAQVEKAAKVPVAFSK